MTETTPRELEALRAIAKCLAEFRQPSPANDHLKALEKKCLIRRARGTARALALTARGQSVLLQHPEGA